MLSEEQAFNIAEEFFLKNISQSDSHISTNGKVVLYSDLEKTEEGWYAFYQTENFILKNDLNYALVDNTPIFVSNDGSLVEFKHLPLKE